MWFTSPVFDIVFDMHRSEKEMWRKRRSNEKESLKKFFSAKKKKKKKKTEWPRDSQMKPKPKPKPKPKHVDCKIISKIFFSFLRYVYFFK